MFYVNRAHESSSSDVPSCGRNLFLVLNVIIAELSACLIVTLLTFLIKTAISQLKYSKIVAKH